MSAKAAESDRRGGARAAATVILAAGKGTRMRSSKPKVLHEIGGAPLLHHVIDVSATLEPDNLVVVVGHGAEAVASAGRARFPSAAVAVQEPQLGTAHAVQQARAALEGFEGDVFVLYADTPLIQPETLRAMSQARADGADLVVLGFEPAEPGGYGRLVLDEAGDLARIVEAKDAAPEELAIRLCNSGVMCLDGARLFKWLDQVEPLNAKGEYYLTDVVEIARREGARAAVVRCPESEVLGVNSRVDLARAEAAFQAQAREAAMVAGVTLVDPASVTFAHDTELAADVVVEPHVVFGPRVSARAGARIRAFSHLEGCAIGEDAVVGPYARLRPGAEIGAGARVGNFVEIKNAALGAGAKANHLSYLGDAEVGPGANVGAGTITCNYDGFFKHRTVIGENAFIGSNSALVAPVRIGAEAIVGAGSTVTEDAPDGALVIARGRQATLEGRALALRKALHAAKNADKDAKKNQ